MERDKADTAMLRAMIDAFPALVFVVDDDVRIHEWNAAAAGFLRSLRKEAAGVLMRRGGHVMECIHSADVSEGCGFGPSCRDCVVRNSVGEAFSGGRAVRRRTKLEIIKDGKKADIYALITASPFECAGKTLVLLVMEDISEIAELYRIIPICAVCRKVRGEKEAWQRVETYFAEHWGMDFSHGLCPECYETEREKIREYRAAHTERQR